jgi:hypothetical protein
VAVEIELKGAPFYGTLTCVEKLHGAATREAVMHALPPDLAEKIRTRTILVGSWYPMSWYRDLLAAVRKQGIDGEEQLRALGHASALVDVTTLYRALFRVLSPELVARNAGRLLSTFYRGDFRVEVKETKPGMAMVEFTGFHGMDRYCWLDAVYGFEAVFAMVGGKNSRAAIESGGEGATATVSLRWDP